MNTYIKTFLKVDAMIVAFVLPFSLVYTKQQALLSERFAAETQAMIENQTKAEEERVEELTEILVSLPDSPIPAQNKFYSPSPVAVAIPEKKVSLQVAYKVLPKIAQCESSNNQYAASTLSSAKGLLQIINGTWDAFKCEGNVFDRNDNFTCGLKIATRSGLHHWDESKHCWAKLVTPSDLKTE